MDPYLQLSNLQKAIRRNCPELAVNSASLLYEKNLSLLLYRLSIICLEDIGLANLDLVHQFFSTKIKKANIEGGAGPAAGRQYLFSLIEQLCASPKDRTSCDLFYFANNKTEITSLSHAQQILDEDNHHDLNKIFNQLSAIFYLLSPKAIKYLENQAKLPPEKVREILSNYHLPEKMIDIILFASTFHREGMFLSLPLCYQYFQLEKNHQFNSKIKTGDIIENKKIENPVYNHLLLSAIDGHTRPGLRAIYQFLNQNKELKSYQNQHDLSSEEMTKLVKTSLFLLEGSIVSSRLYYPLAHQVYNYPFNLPHLNQSIKYWSYQSVICRFFQFAQLPRYPIIDIVLVRY